MGVKTGSQIAHQQYDLYAINRNLYLTFLDLMVAAGAFDLMHISGHALLAK